MTQYVAQRTIIGRENDRVIEKILEKDFSFDTTPRIGENLDDNGHDLGKIESLDPATRRFVLSRANPWLTTLEELVHAYVAQGWRIVH